MRRKNLWRVTKKTHPGKRCPHNKSGGCTNSVPLWVHPPRGYGGRQTPPWPLAGASIPNPQRARFVKACSVCKLLLYNPRCGETGLWPVSRGVGRRRTKLADTPPPGGGGLTSSPQCYAKRISIQTLDSNPCLVATTGMPANSSCESPSGMFHTLLVLSGVSGLGSRRHGGSGWGVTPPFPLLASQTKTVCRQPFAVYLTPPQPSSVSPPDMSSPVFQSRQMR